MPSAAAATSAAPAVSPPPYLAGPPTGRTPPPPSHRGAKTLAGATLLGRPDRTPPPVDVDGRPLGAPLTRRHPRDRPRSSPYLPPDADTPDARPVYPKRKSPFKRAGALMAALNEEEAARMVLSGRAVVPALAPDMAPGDVLRVSYVRGPAAVAAAGAAGAAEAPLAHFTGVVMRVRRAGLGSVFVLRNVVDGVAVERGWMTYSPLVRNVELLWRKKVRRAKLYYLREKPLRESTFGSAPLRPAREEGAGGGGAPQLGRRAFARTH
ncbi:hypothetical protein BU14_0442s0016 [Porphyra umbilicalis]|uniref:Ribosomal protein L19 n=1 Tax=Porphyra umbilicalis TaxID=2786 RepID=A0A1X6NUV4_PORUM|nr:hypothetical protein BU14_0442s0016 [Porphyra umbilicalis]|eukprot:OSX72381.1 hypothetical protein BU14_0442s0016 [Porphyra umbilicalis]